MKKSQLILFSALVMLLAACGGNSYKRTKSGLMYKIISDEKNPIAKQGQFIKFEYVQKIRDSVLFSSELNGPAYVPVDTSGRNDYNPEEIFKFLRKGDSAVVIIEADTIRKKNNGELPPFLKPKDKVILTLKVVEVFANSELADADRNKEVEKIMKAEEEKAQVQKVADLKILNDYLKSKGITAQSAPNGTLVEILKQGDGPACDSGKYVTIAYTGQTLAGKVFDSSIDPKFGHPGQPYSFMIGSPRGAIAGWNDGLRLFKKGGKGRLYIPSSLGYGKRGAGGDIKPDENLIFDIEVVDVADKMPDPQMPPMPDTTTRKK